MSGEWRNGETWPVGLFEVAANTFAYVQAPGSAGISNAGVVLGPDRAVVVDALTTNPMALLPLILIPAYMVPFFAMLHFTALFQARQLARNGKSAPAING